MTYIFFAGVGAGIVCTILVLMNQRKSLYAHVLERYREEIAPLVQYNDLGHTRLLLSNPRGYASLLEDAQKAPAEDHLSKVLHEGFREQVKRVWRQLALDVVEGREMEPMEERCLFHKMIVCLSVVLEHFSQDSSPHHYPDMILERIFEEGTESVGERLAAFLIKNASELAEEKYGDRVHHANFKSVYAYFLSTEVRVPFIFTNALTAVLGEVRRNVPLTN